VSFALGDWVLDHPDVPHNLAISGMRDSLRSLPAALRTLPTADPPALRARLGRLYGVRADRVFLTHGATEANALILQFLARPTSDRTRLPLLHTPIPEYPPIGDAAIELGFRRTEDPRGADLVALSSPCNPLGTRVPLSTVREYSDSARAVLVDQTFREFTEDPPVTRAAIERLWLSGSFTKIFGADDLRVGFAIAPEASVDAFRRLHGLLLDRLAPRSVSGALAVLAHRASLLSEARGVFRANERYLRAHIDGVPNLAAPVWFDRGTRGLDGDRWGMDLLKAGVLVCSGSYFGEPRGIRIALTRRSFPVDLDAYLERIDRS
jgi:histidinol-phosphate/aromatic aminotransferase/cobyric acid decarboxylase-like protein